MAQIIPCDGPHDVPPAASFLINYITEAEVVGLCAACIIDWSTALLTALAPDALAPPPKPAARPRKPKAAEMSPAEAAGLVPAEADSAGG